MAAIVGKAITEQVNLCHFGKFYVSSSNGAHSSLCIGLVHCLCHVTVLIFSSNPVDQVVLSCCEAYHVCHNETGMYRKTAAPLEGLF